MDALCRKRGANFILEPPKQKTRGGPEIRYDLCATYTPLRLAEVAAYAVEALHDLIANLPLETWLDQPKEWQQ